MKNHIKFIVLSVAMMMGLSVKAQTINWGSITSEDRHIVNVNAGMDYGVAFGVGYAYRIKSNLFPMVANVEYSFPAGENIFDDLKIKVGMQISLLKYKNFQFSTKLHGVIRRYENHNVRLVNFGSDLAGILGYYRSGWFVAGEVGFDKAIITHFKHSDAYMENYQGAQQGWYGPTTGGNFYYGVQAGFSAGMHDVYARGGKILTQDFRTKPTLPFYGQLGYNLRF